MDSFPVHAVYELEFPEFTAEISVLSAQELQYEIKEGRYERQEVVNYQAFQLRPGVFVISWQEKDKSTVVHIEDFENKKIYSFGTPADHSFIRTIGNIRFVQEATH
jgi:predicted homoserine dehydrogenase-like protein